MRNKLIVRYHNIIVKLRECVIKTITELRRPNMQAADINRTSVQRVRTTEQDAEGPSCGLMKLSEEGRENFSESQYNSVFNQQSSKKQREEYLQVVNIGRLG